ncbi:hypothetical protein FMM58_05515 [Campylobacter sp. LR291e]|nr:hypothetical protein FMM55_08345 [Campylobacter sp. LR196d]KAA6225331.1 hypothetical protein FMM57_08025 [Campylobacter sp. LR286c]KAA6225602.1 hypothetical protein FMM54_05895 [Campylobacter sp. LR185c]KAA6230455.1 hypothetical protein FMM58_05515 [Campylobacter sp. LR291e]KAA6230571.1 hypothetical protein FMM56_05920 [Campylobacter sp. LR264d]
MRICIFLLSIFVFCACSNKNGETKLVNLKTQTLMFSQKQRIVNESENNESAVLILAYLNPILDNPSSDDIFVLSITPDSFKIIDLSIIINNQSSEISELARDDILMKYLINNDFTRYFKIRRKSISNERNFVVKICPFPYDCFELNLEKYSKSLYYRSVDVDTQYN